MVLDGCNKMADTAYMKQKRATTGGEIGPNGEFYKGGAFIATTEKPKGPIKTHMPRKVEIERGVYVMDKENEVSVYRQIAGVEIRSGEIFIFNPNLRNEYNTPEAVQLRKTHIEAYNAGFRWKNILTGEFLYAEK